MDQANNLYNPGFVGSQFHWWLGQVADSSSWRDNINDTSYESPEDCPGWGYRYKVRIIGLHDEGEIIPDDQLPWAQVMYSVWGGGQGGSFQTPGIKEGMFVFGFFLDGNDEQVPIIMGVLGNNAKTKIEGLGQKLTEYAPKSAYRDDGTTKTSDNCKKLKRNNFYDESADSIHLVTMADFEESEIENRCQYIPCPKDNDSMSEISTIMENFQKGFQKLTDKLNQYPDAAASKKTNEDITKLITDTASLIANPVATIMKKIHDYTLEKLNEKTKDSEKDKSILDRLKQLEKNVAAQNKLACVFSKIKGDLARLIAAALRKSLKRRGSSNNFVPPSPPEGYYYPNPPCETEALLADIMSGTINDMMRGFDDAIDLTSTDGERPQSRLSNALSQENVITAFENGQLYAGIGAALAASVGIDANQSGAISSAFQSGNYAAALTTLVDKSGSNEGAGALSSSLQSLDNNDIVGAFSSLSGPLGTDPKFMEAIGATLDAATTGNMLGLTNAVGNLGGIAPQVLTDVLGGRLPISGIDIGGFGALGGLNFDMALASTFISTTAAFLECTKEEKCSKQKKLCLNGEDKESDGGENIVGATSLIDPNQSFADDIDFPFESGLLSDNIDFSGENIDNIFPLDGGNGEVAFDQQNLNFFDTFSEDIEFTLPTDSNIYSVSGVVSGTREAGYTVVGEDQNSRESQLIILQKEKINLENDLTFAEDQLFIARSAKNEENIIKWEAEVNKIQKDINNNNAQQESLRGF